MCRELSRDIFRISASEYSAPFPADRKTDGKYSVRTRRRCLKSYMLTDFDGWLVMWFIGWQLICRLYEYPHCWYWCIRAIRGVSSWQPMKSIGICTSCNRHVPHYGARTRQSGLSRIMYGQLLKVVKFGQHKLS